MGEGLQYSPEEEAEAFKFNKMVQTGELTKEEVSNAQKIQSPMEVLIEKKHAEANEFQKIYESGQASMEDLKENIGPLTTPEQLMETLQRQKEGRALNYLIGIPGATVHVISKGEGAYRNIFDQVRNGKEIAKDPDRISGGEFGTTYERFISLNVAQNPGENGSLHGCYSWIYAVPAYGFVLKPEFFMNKIANIDEEEVDRANRNHYSWASDDSVDIVCHHLKQNIKIRSAVLEGQKPVYVDKDVGIRAATVKNGEIVAVPITAEDVACFFELTEGNPISEGWNMTRDKNGQLIAVEPSKQFQLKTKLLHSDGTLFSNQEIDELVLKAAEEQEEDSTLDRRLRPYTGDNRPFRLRKNER